MTNLVKAKMSFYHDQVGSRANGEVFEVSNGNIAQQLEQAGYVTKVDSETQDQHQNQASQQEKMGQRQALTNEAVSMTHHVQNQEANAHTQQVQQTFKQQQQQHQTSNAHSTENHVEATPKQQKRVDK